MASGKVVKVTEINQPSKEALEAWHALIEQTARRIATKPVSQEATQSQ